MDSVHTERLDLARRLFFVELYVRSDEICDLLLKEGVLAPELLHLKALNLIRIGRLAEAKQFLLKCLKKAPENEKAWLDLAYIFSSQGGESEALEAYRKAISINPSYSDAYNGIAVLNAKMGDRRSAIKVLKQALLVNPKDATSAVNLARILEHEGDLESALKIYQNVLPLSPTVKNYQLLVSICQKLGLEDLAISNCHKGLEKHPSDFALRRQLVQLKDGPIAITPQVDQKVSHVLEIALQLLEAGVFDRAIQEFENLYRDYPFHPLVLYHYGSYWVQNGSGEKLENGLAMLERAILIFPEFVEPYKMLARHFYLQEDFDSVILIATEGIQHNSQSIDLCHMLGMAFKETDQVYDAIRVLENGMKVGDNITIDMHNDLGLLYTMDGQFTKSQNCYQRALAIDTDFYPAKFNLGLLFSRSGRINESIEIFESLPSLNRNAYEALLYAIACHPQKHRQLPNYLSNWAEKYANRFELSTITPKKSIRKKIRIGYVSPDFRDHPVGYFMVGPYTNHDRSNFEIYSYYNGTIVDEYTLHLKKYTDKWYDVKHLSDKQLAEQVRNDEIDILVDLSGHTSNNRLSVFVGKPAPIQVTYLGYLATTGISQIDYRLLDSYSVPDICTEEIIELPNCYLCYQPFRLNVPTSSHAQGKKRHVTFGSFHRLTKIHQHLVATWSKILLQVPNSVLLLKTRYLDSPDIQDDLLNQFSSYGVDSRQITLKGHANSSVEHLSSYDEIDIMLDSFPYNGTTITCESLWMGVPVVVLAGDLHLSRVGVSINTNAGLTDLVAQNESEYIRIATELAQDERRLLKYNQTLRNQFLNSKVCDAASFTKNLEEAYKSMYDKWINDD